MKLMKFYRIINNEKTAQRKKGKKGKIMKQVKTSKNEYIKISAQRYFWEDQPSTYKARIELYNKNPELYSSPVRVWSKIIDIDRLDPKDCIEDGVNEVNSLLGRQES